MCRLLDKKNVIVWVVRSRSYCLKADIVGFEIESKDGSTGTINSPSTGVGGGIPSNGCVKVTLALHRDVGLVWPYKHLFPAMHTSQNPITEPVQISDLENRKLELQITKTIEP